MDEPLAVLAQSIQRNGRHSSLENERAGVDRVRSEPVIPQSKKAAYLVLPDGLSAFETWADRIVSDRA